MTNNVLLQLGVFVMFLIALNFFFHLHISIIGSLLLTLGVSFVIRIMQSR